MKDLYLYLDIGSIVIPLVFSFQTRLAFFKMWKYAFPAILISALFFILWDIYYTKIGIWGFNSDYLTGVKIFNLPVEEIMFFLCIPYSCLFTWHCLNLVGKMEKWKNIEPWITTGVLIFISLSALLFANRLYTGVTFIMLSVMIILLKLWLKVKWLGRFYITWAILLIPFCIVNGILTGTGLNAPIVWYNNHENMGIRIGTIPVEDIFYGMFLILLNITLYQKFMERDEY